MRRRVTAWAAVATLGAAAMVSLQAAPAVAQGMHYRDLSKIQQRLLSGAADFALRPASSTAGRSATRPGSDGDHNSDADPSVPPSSYRSGTSVNYTPTSASGCAGSIGRTVRVNQECLNLADSDLQGRAQAQNETSIAADPGNEDSLVASANDYRRGDGGCYAYYSRNGGRTWSDSTVPTAFVRGTAFGAKRQYFGGGGDTSVAFDTRGNAYLTCQMFNRGQPTSSNPDVSSALYVYRSTGNGGASWNFPGRPVVESADLAASGVAPFEDKQLMTVDNHTSSPFRDRVYVTYTEFAADGTAYIYASHSSDYAETFSKPVLVSSTSTLCSNNYGLSNPNGNCNENQFSQPFTGPDGNLYVTFANFNNTPTGNDNRNQMLLARSTDGGETFSAPIKVGDYYDLPDCATYQDGNDPGRACVPEKGSTTNSYFRASNYPSGAVSPDGAAVVVTYGSYINRHSNTDNGCTPAGFADDGQDLYTGVKTAGACNNDIQASVSTDGGRTFDMAAVEPREQTSASPAGATDQFQQWFAFTGKGAPVASYFDRQYGDDETTGYSDISVATVSRRGRTDTTRVTSSSMPPPTQFSGTFYGDYSGLAAGKATVHPFWSDTRNTDLFVCPGTATAASPPQVCTGSASNAPIANDQDVYSASVIVAGAARL